MERKNDFRVGDEVRCINPGPHHPLSEGEIYLIKSIDPNDCLHFQDHGIGYHFWRFERVEPEITPPVYPGVKKRIILLDSDCGL